MSDATKTMEEAPETTGRTIRSWARWYDWLHLLTFGSQKRLLRSVVRAAAADVGDAVLDVGCGTGTLALFVDEAVGADGRVEGIDASPEMIAEARKKIAREGGRANVQVALIEEIPFGDGEFDIATNTYVFHHLPDDLKRRGVAEIRRVLKPGGRLLIVDFAAGSNSLIGHLLSIFGHGHSGLARGDYVHDLIGMMEEAGFSDVRRLKSKKHKTAAFIRGVAGEAT
jgi:ubiquinone/menaquinone biosynthesis C-methylase UbiE